MKKPKKKKRYWVNVYGRTSGSKSLFFGFEHENLADAKASAERGKDDYSELKFIRTISFTL